MAFDVYVGTMTRFYRRDWENVVQRMSREQGLKYKVIYAGGEPEVAPPEEEIRQAVRGWCKAMSSRLQPHGCGPAEWNEDNTRPYFTDRPAWDGYSALLVWAAHAENPDLPLPENVPQSWTDDPAYQRSTAREFKSRYHTILEPELWLPSEFPFVFEGPTLVSEKSRIGSVFTLKHQLDELHEQSTIRFAELKETPRVVTPSKKKAGFLGGLFSPNRAEPEPPKPTLVELADLGISVFRDLASKACEHRLPMLLSY